MFLLENKKANNLSEQRLRLRLCTVSFNGLLCHRKCWDPVGRLISLPAMDITLSVLSITLPLPNIDTGHTFIGQDGKLVSLPEMNFTLPLKTLCHTDTGSAFCTWTGRLVSSSKMDFILPSAYDGFYSPSRMVSLPKLDFILHSEWSSGL